MLWGKDGHVGELVEEYLEALRLAQLNRGELPGSLGYEPIGQAGSWAQA